MQPAQVLKIEILWDVRRAYSRDDYAGGRPTTQATFQSGIGRESALVRIGQAAEEAVWSERFPVVSRMRSGWWISRVALEGLRDLRRRNAIEPVIGHQKSDGNLERNHLKGAAGDMINALLSAVGHNLRLLLASVQAASSAADRRRARSGITSLAARRLMRRRFLTDDLLRRDHLERPADVLDRLAAGRRRSWGRSRKVHLAASRGVVSETRGRRRLRLRCLDPSPRRRRRAAAPRRRVHHATPETDHQTGSAGTGGRGGD